MFSTLILFAIFGVSLAYPIYEGTDCLLRNNAIGVCRNIKRCPGGMKLIKNNKFGEPSSVIRCGFEGNDPIICCPNTTPSTEKNEDFVDRDKIIFDYNGWNHYTTPSNTKPVSKRPSQPPSNRFNPTKKSNLNIESRISNKQCEKYKSLEPLKLSTHIIDGEFASEEEFPHIAALGYTINDELVFDCGGTLISERFVITAAHCIINNKRVRPHLVRMGSIQLEDGNPTTRIDYEIENIIVHPEYKTTSKYHDIALLRLAKPVEFSESVFPACLYPKTDDPAGSVTVVGWGMTDAKRDSRSPVLLKADIKVLPNAQCNSEYKKVASIANGITQQQMCAADPQRTFKEAKNKDTCQGDSGGPLEIQYNKMSTLVGITSFSQGECGSMIPGVYVRVSAYLDWIEPIVWPSES